MELCFKRSPFTKRRFSLVATSSFIFAGASARPKQGPRTLRALKWSHFRSAELTSAGQSNEQSKGLQLRRDALAEQPVSPALLTEGQNSSSASAKARLHKAGDTVQLSIPFKKLDWKSSLRSEFYELPVLLALILSPAALWTSMVAVWLGRFIHRPFCSSWALAVDTTWEGLETLEATAVFAFLGCICIWGVFQTVLFTLQAVGFTLNVKIGPQHTSIWSSNPGFSLSHTERLTRAKGLTEDIQFLRVTKKGDSSRPPPKLLLGWGTEQLNLSDLGTDSGAMSKDEILWLAAALAQHVEHVTGCMTVHSTDKDGELFTWG